MAKVTLLTSREIFLHFDLINNDGSLRSNVSTLTPSEKYNAVFQKKCSDERTGIINHILNSQDEDIANMYAKCDKNDIGSVAQCIKPSRSYLGDFKAEIYKYEQSGNFFYFAWEYPYLYDSVGAKYQYLDAILEMIFIDLQHENIEFFNMYSHDRDFDYDENDLPIKELEKVEEKIEDLEHLFNEYVNKNKGKVILFHHNSSCFSKIVEEIKNGINTVS